MANDTSLELMYFERSLKINYASSKNLPEFMQSVAYYM